MVFCLALNAGCTATAKAANSKTTTFKVDGMTCGSCAMGIQTKLEDTKGVRSAKVTYDPPHAVVEFDGTLTSEADLLKVIKAAGYTAQKVDKAAKKTS